MGDDGKDEGMGPGYGAWNKAPIAVCQKILSKM